MVNNTKQLSKIKHHYEQKVEKANLLIVCLLKLRVPLYIIVYGSVSLRYTEMLTYVAVKTIHTASHNNCTIHVSSLVYPILHCQRLL